MATLTTSPGPRALRLLRPPVTSPLVGEHGHVHRTTPALSADGATSAGGTVVHRLPAEAKLLAHVAFVLVVVATPRETFWAFGVYAALVLASIALARLRPVAVLRRMTVETPFVLFALVLPFVAVGPRQEVLGLSLSTAGLLAGWSVLAKATLGVLASILLAGTTTVAELLSGLRVLRVPPALVTIAAFMVRYLGIVREDLRRMHLAQLARGLRPDRRARLHATARAAGAVFIRTYERGERVHLAMLARGGGAVVAARPPAPGRAHPALAAVLPAAAAVTFVVATLGAAGVVTP